MEGKIGLEERGKVVEGSSLSSPAQKPTVNRSTIFNLGKEKVEDES
jgi:hypothetical protein